MYKYYILYIIIILSFSFFIFYQKRKHQKEREDLIAKYESDQLEFCSPKIQQQKEKIQLLQNEITEKISLSAQLQQSCASLQENYDAACDNIDQQLEQYKARLQEQIDSQLRQESEQKQLELQNQLDAERINLLNLKQQGAQLLDDLNDLRLKQQAANEDLKRRKEKETQRDFYRVILQPDCAADIQILTQAKQNLKKSEIMDKIIYDNYISKPVLEMIKRVLNNLSFSGIYKITCIPTEEVYIGKSTDIKSRWQQHCKTAFNCGTIASSLLHTKMKQYGIENFTFEVLEKVPKEKLTEREKYWIDFYQTKEMGLNERKG